MKRALCGKNLRSRGSIFTSFAVASLMMFAGCQFGSSKKKERSVVVVNVLTKELYDDCHIPGSVHVDFDKVSEASWDWSKKAKIVIYCANYACTTSAMVVRDLKNHGFDAYEYAAGMAGWKQAGLPVEGPAQSPYLNQPNEHHGEVSDAVPVVTTEQLQQWMNGQEGIEK